MGKDQEKKPISCLLVSKILRYLAAMGAWHFLYFVAFVTDQTLISQDIGLGLKPHRLAAHTNSC